MIGVTQRHFGGTVSPHQFRRGFGINSLERGGSESGLMRIAGWSSTEMIRSSVAGQADRLAHDEMRKLRS
jgi:hypothetical protein